MNWIYGTIIVFLLCLNCADSSVAPRESEPIEQVIDSLIKGM